MRFSARVGPTDAFCNCMQTRKFPPVDIEPGRFTQAGANIARYYKRLASIEELRLSGGIFTRSG